MIDSPVRHIRARAKGGCHDCWDYLSPDLQPPLPPLVPPPQHPCFTTLPWTGSSGTGQVSVVFTLSFRAHPGTLLCLQRDCPLLQMTQLGEGGGGCWWGTWGGVVVSSREGVRKPTQGMSTSRCTHAWRTPNIRNIATGVNASEKKKTKKTPLFMVQGQREGTEALKQDLEWILLS